MKKTISLMVALIIVFSSLGTLIYAQNGKDNEKVKIVEQETVNEIYDTQNEKTKVMIELKVSNKNDLKVHQESMDVLADKVKKTKKLGKSEALIKNTISTVTFTQPASVSDLQELEEKYDVEIVNYEVKFINQDNIWGTGCLEDLSEKKIDELKEKIITEGKEESLEYIGITSARVKLNLLKNSYEDMCTDPLIYLVDLTDLRVRLENEDFSKELKIQVPDLAWEIEKIK